MVVFTRRTYEEIVTDLNSRFRSEIDPALDVSPEAPLGQLIGIFAEQLASAYEAAETAYNAFDIEKSEKQSLDGLVLLNGLTRIPAKKSAVTLTLDLNASVTIPAGSIVAVAGQPNNRWLTLAAVTSVGAGTYEVEAEAEFTGPTLGLTGTITQIVTAVSGWNSVTNSADAIVGRNVETDAQLRVRFKSSQADSGQSTVSAIRAALLALTDMISVNVLENDTDFVDSNGLPPHSFEAICYGTAAAASIAQAIWDNKPAGIPTHGSSTANATDEFGAARAVKYSVPTVRDVYVDVTVLTGPGYAGDAAVKEAIIASLLGPDGFVEPGEDVTALKLRAAALNVAGVLDVPVFELDFAPSPSATANLSLGPREVAQLLSANITVTAT